MANTLVTPSWVLPEVTRQFMNNIVFGANVTRDYDDDYRVAGAKMGDTVKARLPQEYQVSLGASITPVPVTDRTVDISITTQANIPLAFGARELTLFVDDYNKRYLSPATNTLSNYIDADGLQKSYKKIYQAVGTLGTPATANTTYTLAGQYLDEIGAPDNGERVAILTPAARNAITNANIALFNPSSVISQAFRKNQFTSDALGIGKWFWSQNVGSHTVGAYAGTPRIDGGGQTAGDADLTMTLNTKGWTASTSVLNEGDIFTIANVFKVNPLTKISTGTLQQFVVRADITSSAGGLKALTIAPAIRASGQFQNVDSVPADSALITVNGTASSTGREMLVYHPDAVALVFADLYKPAGGLEVSERVSSRKLGVSFRFLKDFAIMTDLQVARLDALYGWQVVRPEFAVRVRG